jgi:hypothetical protein
MLNGGIEALYGASPQSQHGLDVLVQAMASFGGPSAADSSTILASLDQPRPRGRRLFLEPRRLGYRSVSPKRQKRKR